MAGSKTYDELFVEHIRDMYDAEKQLVKALGKLARGSTDPNLRSAFEAHRAETEDHVSLLEDAFALLNTRPRGKHCAGIAGIIEEGDSAIEDIEKSAVRDVALIGGGRLSEHYEITAYRSLIAHAKVLGHGKVADIFQTILRQEEAADQKLEGLSKSASGAAQRESSELQQTAQGGRA